jgi:hypothetical protein
VGKFAKLVTDQNMVEIMGNKLKSAFRIPHQVHFVNKAIIWGINEYTDRVINYSQRIGLQIIYVITDDSLKPIDGNTYNGIPILSVQDERKIDPSIPVVLTDIEPGDKNTIIQTINHISKGSKRKVIHPAAFYDLYTSPHINKVGIFGLPGSGNMIFQTILTDVLPIASLDDTEVDLKWFMSCYHNFWVKFIESELSVSHWVTVPVHTGFSGLMFSLTPKGADSLLNPTIKDFIYIAGFPIQAVAWSDRFISNHEFLVPSTEDYYVSHGARPVVILRHPLDIILSIANKTDSPYKHLNDRKWLDNISKIVCFYFNGYASLKQSQTTKFVRYEKLLTKPTNTIVNLSKDLGVIITKGKAEELWKKYGLKPIPATSVTHYNEPSINKHKNYFHQKHLKIFQANGLIDAAKKFGYTIDIPLKEEKRITKVQKKTNSTPELLLAIGLPPFRKVDVRSHLLNQGLVQYIIPETSLNLADVDQLENHLKEFISSEVFQTLYSSATWKAKHIPTNMHSMMKKRIDPAF